MGKCQSKAGALEDGDRAGQDVRARKSNKRKWRKSKGYSLSASLESGLHCGDEDRLVTRGTPKNGLVLVSYSVTDLESRHGGSGGQNPGHQPPLKELVSREITQEEEKEERVPPLAESEGEVSCYSTPARSLPQQGGSAPPLTITTVADVAVVPPPSIHLSSSPALRHQHDTLSLDSFASVEITEEVSEIPEITPASSPLPSPSPQRELVSEKPRVTFSAGQDYGEKSQNGDGVICEPGDCAVGISETEDGELGICGSRSGPREAPLAAPLQERKASVLVSNQQSQVNVPVPTNISDILHSGLATIAFLDLPEAKEAQEDANDEDNGEEEKEEDDLHVIVQPPLIFSGRPSPADFHQLENCELEGIGSFASGQNANEGCSRLSSEEAPSPREPADTEAGTEQAPDAAICRPSLPLVVESGTGCEGHEKGFPHEIGEGAAGESGPEAVISAAGGVQHDTLQEEQSETDEHMRVEEVPEDRAETEDSANTGAKTVDSPEAEHSSETAGSWKTKDNPKTEHNAKTEEATNIEGTADTKDNSETKDSADMEEAAAASRFMTVTQLKAMFSLSTAPEEENSPHCVGVGGSTTQEGVLASSGAEEGVLGSWGGEQTAGSGEGGEPGAGLSAGLHRAVSKYRDSPEEQEEPETSLGEGQEGERPSKTIMSKQGMKDEKDAHWRQFSAESEQSETADEFSNDERAGGRQGNEPRTGCIRRERNASTEAGEGLSAEIRDNYEHRSEGVGERLGGDACQPGRTAATDQRPARWMLGLARDEQSEQEGPDKSCKGSEGSAIGMQEEADAETYASDKSHPHARGEGGRQESCDNLPRAPCSAAAAQEKSPTQLSAQPAKDKNSILTNCDDSADSVKNSNLEQIRKVAGDEETLSRDMACTDTVTNQVSLKRARVVSFSLDLVSHDDYRTQVSHDSSPTSEDLSDSLAEDAPKSVSHAGDPPGTPVYEVEDEEAATLSDISPICDFAALPELPVEEEWASMVQEAARATAWGKAVGRPGQGHDDEDRTIIDDHTDVSFSLPIDPVRPRLSPTDSCLDLTSPTPSHSASSSDSWQHDCPLQQSGYTSRLPPQGCSASSEDDEGAEVGSSEECYDSLEDLKRGAGLRKLPAVPVVVPRREVARSQTFTSQGSHGGQGSQLNRRRLPQVPPRAVSVAGREEVGGREEGRARRAVSVGRELPARPQRRSRVDISYCDDKSQSPETSLDSGCHSFEPYGEETSVDAPPLEANLLPRRNPSNFLWVDFQEEKPAAVVRRPKNHDRLTQARKAQNRHSAPPGSLEGGQGGREGSLEVGHTAGTQAHAKKNSLGSSKKAQTQWRGQRPQSAQGAGTGRIHSAVVSGINVETKSVTVEWFERGETKGKEIELEQILGLNQDLAPTSYENANTIPNKQKYVAKPPAPAETKKVAATTGNAGSKRNPGRQSHVISSNGHKAGTDHGEQNGGAQVHLEPMQPPKTIPPLKQEIARDETVSKATAAAAQGVNRRRSNVVKEVERLKENREKRRAQQAQILEDQEVLRNKDPGNPNWEFLQMILDYKETLEFNPLEDGDPMSNHQITVCIRKRPMSQKEVKRKDVDVVTVPNKDQITIHEPKSKVDLTKYLENQHFRFDCAFDETATNEMVYKYTARSLVQSIFEGGMATCFAYGQTGSGKTHTMGGEFHGKSQDSKNGIYAFATRDVFKLLKSPKYKNNNLTVSCSFFEIYSGKVFDLLSGKSKLRVLEDGKQQVVIVGLTEAEVDTVEDVLTLITKGNNQRTSGQTSANAHSSRSHAVFQIILRENKGRKPLFGKFSLIDLAGNERGADTSSANRQTRMEGAEINKSLLALKECIRALGRKGAHLPFRASKLTQVLRDSFIGDKARTCMIAMISPSMNSCEHTLNTLRYADRVKELQTGKGGGQGNRVGNSLDYEQDDDLLGSSMGDLDSDHGRMEDGVLSPEDSDLAQLRSLNDGECSADWYNFQESVQHLQALEEEVVESHKNLLDSMEHWIQQDASLLAMTNEVDYDQDAYAQQLEDMIAEKQEQLATLRERTRAFRECLNDEEVQSNKMNQNRRH